jgi:hypothetical protein
VPKKPRHDLPYLLHTNRELGLMLKGLKPLAMFVDGEGRFPDCVLRYLRMFDRHVASGRLVRRDVFFLNDDPALAVERWHRIFFALPGEAWRIDAMIELKARSGRWTLEMERREGELLGYEDWQNDIWLSRL